MFPTPGSDNSKRAAARCAPRPGSTIYYEYFVRVATTYFSGVRSCSPGSSRSHNIDLVFDIPACFNTSILKGNIYLDTSFINELFYF